MYVESKVMQQVAKVANPLVVGGVFLQMLHQELDHVLDGL